jgi:hypothetical protein
MKDAAPRATTIGMRARAMAVRIRRRHARDELAARHPEMLLARIPVATLQVAYSASHIHWAPRIALTFASAGGSPRVVSPARGHGAAAESRRLRVDHVVQRLTARAIRVFSVAPPARDIEPGAPTGAVPPMRFEPRPEACAPAVPRILRRARFEMPDPATGHEPWPAAVGIANRAAWPGWPEPTSSTRPAPPSVDLDQLTDRVVSALNRRVTAHRERLGR